MSPITIVDYGMGNLGSIANMLAKLGVASQVSGDPAVVGAAERLILPGVGSFDAAVERLEDTGLIPALHHAVGERHVPVLGICLGMQLLASGSDEGVRRGLGWIPGQVRRLSAEGDDGPVKIPHMGWSTVAPTRLSATLPTLGADGARYYFVHSYAFVPDDPDAALGVAHHGRPFAAAVERDHIAGVQFHPEKSHRHGMALLAGFAGV